MIVISTSLSLISPLIFYGSLNPLSFKFRYYPLLLIFNIFFVSILSKISWLVHHLWHRSSPFIIHIIVFILSFKIINVSRTLSIMLRWILTERSWANRRVSVDLSCGCICRTLWYVIITITESLGMIFLVQLLKFLLQFHTLLLQLISNLLLHEFFHSCFSHFKILFYLC